jgi:hypothetical protein
MGRQLRSELKMLAALCGAAPARPRMTLEAWASPLPAPFALAVRPLRQAPCSLAGQSADERAAAAQDEQRPAARSVTARVFTREE